jgi:hypothetical protein
MVKIEMIVLVSMVLLGGFAIAENETVVLNETLVNDTIQTNLTTNISSASLEIKNFFPREAKIGDIQLSINVHNIGDRELSSLYAFVSGDGFSSYNIVPIDSLQPREKSYILVSGNFRKAGAINLTIRINQETFYQTVNVLDDSDSVLAYNKELAANLSRELSILKNNYSVLESDIKTKKDEGYDVSGVSVADLKVMLRDAQTNLLSENLIQTKVKLDLAQEEYQIQFAKMSKLSKISLAFKLKDNAVLFSTLAGAIITFFTLYELLKRKKENLRETIKSIKIKDKAGNSYSVKTGKAGD